MPKRLIIPEPVGPPDGIRRGASFSACRRYRYALTRRWAEGETALFIGLNPSTADHRVNDPTVRRCIGFARSWGHGRLVLVNLFALRSADPIALAEADDPVGPLNDEVIDTLLPEAQLVVAAWGNGGRRLGRDRHVLGRLPEVHCLGTTKGGSPRHPLYLPADTSPSLYAV